MPSTIRLVSAALLGVVLITAYLALVKQAEWNGTIDLESIIATPVRFLPNTSIPIKLPSSGIAGIDNYFSFMEAFFYTSTDPRNVRAHVAGNHLLGSLSSIWFLMLAEAHNASSGFLLTTYALEFIGEFAGIGIFIPIWGLVHLFKTPVPSLTSKKPESDTKALAYALVIGHVVPTVLMLRLKADGEGLASQQFWTIARLFHPVLVLASWTFLKTAIGSKTSSQSAFFSRRKFYLFSILASGFFHITSVGWFLAEQIASGWIKDEVSAALSFSTIVVPGPFWSPAAVGKVAWEDGVAIFLQWDYICAVAAIYVWAASMFLEARSLGRDATGSSALEVFGQSALVSVLAGPAAGGAYLLSERDAVLAAQASLVDKKGL